MTYDGGLCFLLRRIANMDQTPLPFTGYMPDLRLGMVGARRKSWAERAHLSRGASGPLQPFAQALRLRLRTGETTGFSQDK